jgi:manganese-dependent inorganic pyrophosphatase
MPIYIDIRPWGSMSSIITHNFLSLRRRPKKSTAGMLLCAILSDTLNLQSPTTTEWDRLMVAILVQLAGVEDVQFLASQQFKAKSSELAGLTAKALITGDQKVFTYKTEKFDGAVAFAVVETTDDEVILNRSAELLVALSEDKESSGVSLTYLAVVNIVELRTTLLLVGPEERSLAASAFPNGKFLTMEEYSEPYAMDLGNLVSRKKDFIPAVSSAMKKGWSNAPSGRIHMSKSDVFDFSKYQDSSLTLKH